MMGNAPQQLRDLGQSLWLDNITRDMLRSGTLARYIKTLSVTGLTSNPSIFNQAIGKSSAYDDTIQKLASAGGSSEEHFFKLAIEDLTQAADLFRPLYDSTQGVDGWVSLEVSPLLAYDTQTTLGAAKQLHARANRPNLFIKIPGTKEGLPAIEEATFAGVPVNITLLFSTEQYLAAADAYLRGLERRIAENLSPNVVSVASLFISRWDTAVANQVGPELQNRLGLAIGQQAYQAYREWIDSPRWQRAQNFGARPQRLLFASTGTKDPKASDILYIRGLAAPFTINTMPENTLLAFAEHGEVASPLAASGDDCTSVLQAFTAAGVDLKKLAEKLQSDGAAAFVKSWNELMDVIAEKSKILQTT